jgi:hypothetical protein
LLVAAIVRAVRGAAVVFLGLAGGLAALHATRDLLVSISLGERSFALSYARDALAFISNFLRWLSPFEYLLLGIDAISAGEGLLLWLMAFAYTFILFLCAIFFLRRESVLP